MAGKSKHGGLGIAFGAILGALAAVILGSGGVWLAIGIAVGIAMGAALFRSDPQSQEANDRTNDRRLMSND